MAIHCTNCGKTFTREDLQFCTRCGAHISSHSVPDERSRTAVKPSQPPTAKDRTIPPMGQQGDKRPVIREQIAQQPPSRFNQSPVHNEPPARTNRPVFSNQRPSLSEQGQFGTSQHLPEQLDFPQLQQNSAPKTIKRDLRARVWQPIESAGNSAPKIQDNFTPNDAVENTPTALLRNSPPVQPLQRPPTPGSTREVRRRSEANDFVEEPTKPLLASPSIAPDSRHDLTKLQPPITPQFYPHPAIQTEQKQQLSQSSGSPTAEPRIRLGVQPPAELLARPKRKKREPVILFLIVLLLFVSGGLAAWIILSQPFTVPAITQPQQHFQNTAVGVSLQYPTGWSVQVDQKKGTVNFFDSSHTDQLNIAAVPANGMDVAQYLQKQTTQLGMTGLKPGTPVLFAGTSWQQIQGNTIQNGASFTETLYVSSHGDRLFTIMQLAPPSTYAAEEQITFSPMRLSFAFLR